MSKKDKGSKMLTSQREDDSLSSDENIEGDSGDFNDPNYYESEEAGDADLEDEEYEFDPALALKGIELVDLTPDFIRPEGFLMVPRADKRTGEITPSETTFAGILNDVIPWKDKRGKDRVWFSCTATATIPNMFYVGRDDETKKPFQKPVEKGARIGISGSGAINALKSKKGHFILLHWTGAKKPTKNGDMWEVIAKVSKEPVENVTF
jgi:hypothetical protein